MRRGSAVSFDRVEHELGSAVTRIDGCLDNLPVEHVRVGVVEVLVDGHPETLRNLGLVEPYARTYGAQPCHEVNVRLSVPVPVPVPETHERKKLGDDPCLFFYFAYRSFGDVFAGLQGAAREFVVFACVVALLDHQQIPVFVDHDASRADIVRRERRYVRPFDECQCKLQSTLGRVMIDKPRVDGNRDKSGTVDREFKPNDTNAVGFPLVNRFGESQAELFDRAREILGQHNTAPKGVFFVLKTSHPASMPKSRRLYNFGTCSHTEAMVKEIGTYEKAVETIERLGNGGAFLMTGSEGNPMTIGWGLIGQIWGRPIFQVLVRPSRHSFALLQTLNEFTVCVPTDGHAKALALCGTRSGRDLDKIAACEFTTKRSAHVAVPYIAECPVHYECRVVHINDVVNASIDAEIAAKSYPNGDFHRIYYGEILGVYGA